MKPTFFLSGPLLDLWSDLLIGDPGLLWQLLALMLCAGAASAVARALRRGFGDSGAPGRGQPGPDSFSRVLYPLLWLMFVELAKPLLARWHHINLVRLFIPLLLSFVIIRAAFYILRRIFARDGQASRFLPAAEKAISTFVCLGVALYITNLWPELLHFMDETAIPIGSHKISLLAISQACASVAVTLIIALWAGAMLEDRLMKIETMHSSLRTVVARMARVALIAIALLVSLSLVGIDLTVLSVFGGALGVGLGLGLQKIASSYLSGFVILLERSLAIGDLVTVDKYYGIVTQINTRYTVLKGQDGIESVVPNDILISNPVQNYSLTDSALRLSSTITVGYQTDVTLILRLMEEAAAGVARVLKSPVPRALLLKIGPNGLDIEIGFWIADPHNGRSTVLSDVNMSIWQVLQQQKVELPSIAT